MKGEEASKAKTRAWQALAGETTTRAKRQGKKAWTSPTERGLKPDPSNLTAHATGEGA